MDARNSSATNRPASCHIQSHTEEFHDQFLLQRSLAATMLSAHGPSRPAHLHRRVNKLFCQKLSKLFYLLCE